MRRHRCLLILLLLAGEKLMAQSAGGLAQLLARPGVSAAQKNAALQSAKPWVFWYWMQGAVSKEGITADLEAMKAAGIGGAYLMPIKGVTNPPLMTPATEQLSPRWWEMVRFSMQEAKRLSLEMGMHVSDGFALAGGPWITPERSMQKVVYSSVQVQGGQKTSVLIPQPQTNEGYYKDIRVLAFPTVTPANLAVPKITSSRPGIHPQFLVSRGSKESFRSDTTCWIQYAYEQPFTCRSILIRTGGNNYQAHRLKIDVSDDGLIFRPAGRLVPPRHGWQDTDADVTHAIAPITARFFRFTYDKAGSEPGAEDLDAAKWKPSLRLVGLELSAESRINQFEGKTAAVWRVSERSTSGQLADSQCVTLASIIDLTDKLGNDGRLNWNVPAGNWTILRIGHTSTGQTNATGGAGKGLECDKFDPAAITLQFNSWFGETQRQIGPDLSKDVLKLFHVDSWECGSQNWSTGFADSFKKRRGYDLLPYLPVMAGIPVDSAERSEQVLYDIRRTVAELVVDTFYKTLADLARQHGVTFTAESVAPTMVSDGLAHYKLVDIPMGEFWLNSPTHDKPNDMLDAISAGHIYGKNIIQAEGFTTVRMAWNEHPGMLKTLQDRTYALGINKLVYHVFTHNPWLNRKPGMTLDGVGLYFQRDQTWWKPATAWVDYATRCQALLQLGRPVADIAVYSGDDIPRRSVLPDRLVTTLPGMFGKEVVEREARRLANVGEPLRQIPAGVSHSANMADPEQWINPLRGYAYDSFSADGLATATTKGGMVSFAPGTRYALLVLPQKHPLNTNNACMLPEMLAQFVKLVKEGATLLIGDKPVCSIGKGDSRPVKALAGELWDGPFEAVPGRGAVFQMKKLGKGRVVKTPFQAATLDELGVQVDVIVTEPTGTYAKDIAWTHRVDGQTDIYFVSNQQRTRRELTFSFRVNGKLPELYDAVTDDLLTARQWSSRAGRTQLSLRLEPNASLFVIFRKGVGQSIVSGKNWLEPTPVATLEGPWQVQFDPQFGGPEEPQAFAQLTDWSQHPDSSIRYYSGTAAYTKTISQLPGVDGEMQQRTWLELGQLANIADVKVNGISCGVVWTAPYRVELTNRLKRGENTLTIEVSNTWANRLIGDQAVPESKRITNTTAPFRLAGKPLEKAGLLGPVRVLVQ
ncbi:glycosyl hydrolase [Fibrella forsythiae]|uniref:DNA-binding protein n=1 Tax=Fibrella forsythiae TaxID=2817061 RepID=A0ABS3JD48_9BACT|nr:glycosyl hydrolase [Fibrella forsythiae]MBO0947917.1 DNA-binding protein [Fibrella forsythiae]